MSSFTIVITVKVWLKVTIGKYNHSYSYASSDCICVIE